MQAALTWMVASRWVTQTRRFDRLHQLLRLLVVIAVANSSIFAYATTLESVRHSDSPHFTRVVLDLSAPAKYKLGFLPSPPRYYIDLIDSKLGKQYKAQPISSSQLRKVRIAPRGRNLRVVMDLVEEKTPTVQALTPNGSYGHRLVIDFPHDVVTSCTVEHDNNIVIVVDAGHGGEDPGAIAVNHAMEKDITLKIAKKVRAQIDRQPGFKAVMTRDRDYEVPLESRYRLAQNTKARLFLSIHADAFHNPRPRGASAYVVSDGKARSELAKWLVQNENRSDWVGGVSSWVDSSCYAARAREKLKFLNAKGRQEALAEAVLIGKKMLRSIDKVADVHPKSYDAKRREYKVTDAGFVVLSATATPSLLVETGFLSNPDEARLLSTASYQTRIADAISDSILRHFCENPPRYTDLAEGKVTCDLKPSALVYYQVRRGDSLSLIAARQQSSVAEIRAANALKSDRIYPGQTLTIPVTN